MGYFIDKRKELKEKNNIDGNKEYLLRRIKEEISKIRTYTPRVAIFGDAGVGKSSLCNAIFGEKVAKVSAVKVGTTEVQEITISNGKEGGLILLDFPGIGDGKKNYIKLYKNELKDVDIVIWAIKSDSRTYELAKNIFNEMLRPNIDNCPVLFAITQIDKIDPIDEWYENNKSLGITQLNNLKIKAEDMSLIFGINMGNIIAVSTNNNYNIQELVSKIVEVLPNAKKSSFAREAKEENVSEETYIKAEKGIWDSIKEKFQDTWDTVKDKVIDEIIDNAPKLIEKGLDWLRKKWV